MLAVQGVQEDFSVLQNEKVYLHFIIIGILKAVCSLEPYSSIFVMLVTAHREAGACIVDTFSSRTTEF